MCFPTTGTHTHTLNWPIYKHLFYRRIPALAFESILFFLLIAMFVHKRWNKRMNNTHLLIVFVRDGAWGFAVFFG